ncbi:MAG: S-methyl-5-thioribose-1-phosphate isomerase [Alphaproteobacteria bacterium]|nr:MAG: S-methyl-5-thioribose-1-phosphate isomerase [Alphaproteobacteria bacterium]
MKVNGGLYRTIWLADDGQAVEIIDQTRLPHEFVTARLSSVDDAARAIVTMQTRGAPLIGITAAYGMALAMAQDPSDQNLEASYAKLIDTRPTAINLRWALDQMRHAIAPLETKVRRRAAFDRAGAMADQDIDRCRRIGANGLTLIEAAAAQKKDGPVNVLTHCNAGWLATVDWGTATAPIYMAFDKGIDIHVWVDETRPRNQGAALTAWELGHHGVPHTVIADNVGGHLMQHGLVDLCITGSDRTTARGDVCNKIGTYLKALAAHDNNVPFYVALPGPTIDWTLDDGVSEIPIEQRDGVEVREISGRTADGRIETISLVAPGSPVANYAFDVTPARLVTGLITERGICPASADGLRRLYPQQAKT